MEQTVYQVTKRFRYQDQKAIVRFQHALDRAAGVQTLPFLEADFVAAHRVASSKVSDLIDIMADCVKTAVRKKPSVVVYPIDIAGDGTMTVIDGQPLVKLVTSVEALEQNFGANRLGVAVACSRVQPLGFQVTVGPFLELVEYAKKSIRLLHI